MRSFEYRLYPTKHQEALLDTCLEGCRLLYNEMLELERTTYESSEKFVWKYDLGTAFKGRGGECVPQTTVQCLADRLDKALKKMGASKELGLRGGFPRFKGYLGWHSFQLRQWGTSKDVWLADDRLRVPAKIGKSIKVKLHRPLEGTPKTAYMVKRIDKWFVVIACESEPVAVVNNEPPIGLDVGLKHFLTDSNGDTVANPKHYRTTERKLRTQSRRQARRTKGSKGRRQANIQISKTHLKVERQRRDFHFKVAKQYSEKASTIFVEDLNIGGMVRNHHLAKSISDAAWGQFLNIIASRAERAGSQVVRVPAQYTSQLCSRCGALVPKSMSVRTHVCTACGYVADRDHNAAQNILQRGLVKTREGHSLQEPTYEIAQCVS